jgi:hypothetical protein
MSSPPGPQIHDNSGVRNRRKAKTILNFTMPDLIAILSSVRRRPIKRRISSREAREEPEGRPGGQGNSKSPRGSPLPFLQGPLYW